MKKLPDSRIEKKTAGKMYKKWPEKGGAVRKGSVQRGALAFSLMFLKAAVVLCRTSRRKAHSLSVILSHYQSVLSQLVSQGINYIRWEEKGKRE